MKISFFFSRKEQGQVVVLYAIFILFLVTISMAIVDLGKLVMFKTKVRTVSDQATFSAESVERDTMPIFYHMQEADEVAKLVYSTGIMLDTLYAAAEKLSVYTTSYDVLATCLHTYADIPISSYTTLTNQLLTVSSISEYKNPSFLTMEANIVPSELLEEMHAFALLEQMMVHRLVRDKNIEVSTQSWENTETLYMPVSYFLKRAPLTVGDLGMMTKTSKMISGEQVTVDILGNGSDQRELRSGIFCFQLVDTPDLLVSDLIITNEGKIGKQVFLSYASLSLPPSLSLPNAWLDEYNQQLHETNVEALVLLQNMDDIETPGNGYSWSVKKTKTKEKWMEIKTLYENMLGDFRVTDQLDMQSPDSFFTESYPRMMSLQRLLCEENSDYSLLAQASGYDLTNEEERKTFYRTCSMEDIFSSSSNFFDTVSDSIDELEGGIGSLTENYDTYLDTFGMYGRNIDTPTESLSSSLGALSTLISEHSYINAANSDILLFWDQMCDLMDEYYTTDQSYRALILHREGHDYSSLKPSTDLADAVSSFYGEAIMKWITN